MTRGAALVAFVAVLAAGCGGGDGDNSLDPRLADELAAESLILADAVEHHARCDAIRDGTQTLQQRVITAVNDGEVPEELQEPLQSEINELADEARECSPEMRQRFVAFARWVRERAESRESS